MANLDLGPSTSSCQETSGRRSKSGTEGQYDLINRLRNLLIDLSKEALRDLSIGRNHRAKRLLNVLSKAKISC